jgi:hypothetical protein
MAQWSQGEGKTRGAASPGGFGKKAEGNHHDA